MSGKTKKENLRAIEKSLINEKKKDAVAIAMEIDETLAADVLDYVKQRDRYESGDLDDNFVPSTIIDENTAYFKELTDVQKRVVLVFVRNPGQPQHHLAALAGVTLSEWKRYLGAPHVLKALRMAVRELGMKYSVTQSALLGEMASVLYSDIGDVVQWDESGRVTYKSSEDIPAYKRRAIKELVQTETPNGTVTIKVSMHDKNPVMKLTSAYLGLAAQTDLEEVAEAAEVLAASRRRALASARSRGRQEVIDELESRTIDIGGNNDEQNGAGESGSEDYDDGFV